MPTQHSCIGTQSIPEFRIIYIHSIPVNRHLHYPHGIPLLKSLMVGPFVMASHVSGSGPVLSVPLAWRHKCRRHCRIQDFQLKSARKMPRGVFLNGQQSCCALDSSCACMEYMSCCRLQYCSQSQGRVVGSPLRPNHPPCSAITVGAVFNFNFIADIFSL